MGTQTAKKALFGLAAAAAVVIGGAVAYACIPVATLEINPQSGSPGTLIEAQGRGFTPTGGVEVRLDSETGTLLWNGAPAGGDVNFSFAVPRAAPGTYVVVGVQNGKIGARAGLEITKSASSATGTSNQNTQTQQEQTKQEQTKQEREQAQQEQTRQDREATEEAGKPALGTQPEESVATQPFGSSTGDGQNSAVASRRSSAPLAPATSGARPGFGVADTSPSMDVPAVEGAETAIPVAEEGSPLTPSPGSATSDLWSGFGPGSNGLRSPSLIDAPSSGGPGLGVGIALLGSGLVGLAATSAALARRRRAVVHTTVD